MILIVFFPTKKFPTKIYYKGDQFDDVTKQFSPTLFADAAKKIKVICCVCKSLLLDNNIIITYECYYHTVST